MTDPIEGQEVSMLNTMLGKLWPSAKEGDAESIDRVIKILTLKRRYREDREALAEEWRL